MTAEIFDAHGALDALPAFLSTRFAKFYGLEVATKGALLTNTPMAIADSLSFGDTTVVPFRAGSVTPWTFARSESH